MVYYTYILIALAIAGQVRAAEEAAGAPEPYAYGYEAPDHAAAEERKPDGTVSGYYTLKDADGRSRRVNYVADESGFHANVETNEHGTKTSNPADAQILAAPANPEQLVQYQRVQYQQPQQQVVVSQAPAQKLQQVQYTTGYQYQPGFAYGSGYNFNSYPGNSYYGYGYQPNQAYYQTSGSYYQPGNTVYGTTYNNGYLGYPLAGANYQGLSTSSYGVGEGAVYGGYNYHTPGSYFSAVRNQQVGVVKPQQQFGYVTGAVVPQAGSVYRTVSSTSSGSSVRSGAQPIVGSSNYSIIQKREVEAPKTAQPSQQEKASPEKPGQEKKTN